MTFQLRRAPRCGPAFVVAHEAAAPAAIDRLVARPRALILGATCDGHTERHAPDTDVGAGSIEGRALALKGGSLGPSAYCPKATAGRRRASLHYRLGSPRLYADRVKRCAPIILRCVDVCILSNDRRPDAPTPTQRTGPGAAGAARRESRRWWRRSGARSRGAWRPWAPGPRRAGTSGSRTSPTPAPSASSPKQVCGPVYCPDRGGLAAGMCGARGVGRERAGGPPAAFWWIWPRYTGN